MESHIYKKVRYEPPETVQHSLRLKIGWALEDWSIVLGNPQGSSALVALRNIIPFINGDVLSGTVNYERDIKKYICNTLTTNVFRDESYVMTETDSILFRDVVNNIRTKFTHNPRLSGPSDFEMSHALMLVRYLYIPFFHCCLASPDDDIYNSVKDFTRAELLGHCMALIRSEGQTPNVMAIRKLLKESSNQLTVYGFNCLCQEMPEGEFGLIFCRNRYDVIHKHEGDLFLLVSDEEVLEIAPHATWMLFEFSQERSIYLTSEYIPVKHQPFIDKATEWYSSKAAKKAARQARNRKKKEKAKAKAQGVSLDHLGDDSENKEDIASGLDQSPREMSSNQGVSLDPSALRTGEGSTSSKDEVEVSPDGGGLDSLKDKGRESPEQCLYADKHDDSSGLNDPEISSDQGAHLDSSTQKADESSTSSKDEVIVPPDRGGLDGSEDEDEVRGVLDGSKDEVRVFPKHDVDLDAYENKNEDKSAGLENVGSDNLSSSSSDEKKGGGHEGDSSGSQEGFNSVEVDDVCAADLQEQPTLEGVAYEFFQFLVEFKDKGCSYPYFKGIVEAIRKHPSPRFYAPYEFISAYNEALALKIQDNYSSIQFFSDFVDGIVLHEHYDVFGVSEALPSFDSRRMGIGYLDNIITKFRTGRCWGGKWTEANMKVKNNSVFLIDCATDYELTPDFAFDDLMQFGRMILERLKLNGRLPLYCDEFFKDIAGISEYIKDPVKWERFLQLISVPLALKPPLVRSAFLCNVYLAANGRYSGDPPRYAPLVNRKNCKHWCSIAEKDPLLSKVYNHQNIHLTRNKKYFIDSWSVSHWHLFKFSRNFIQHVLRHMKDEKLIKKVQDISAVDIILPRKIGESIALSVRFLVMDLGVDGLFSSAWRHYVGSDYVDKPHRSIGLKEATGLQELVAIISNNKSGAYAQFEVGILPTEHYVSVMIGDADLSRFALLLGSQGFKIGPFTHAYILFCEKVSSDDFLCGSIVVRRRYPKKGTNSYPVIVVDGPLNTEYNIIIDICSLHG